MSERATTDDDNGVIRRPPVGGTTEQRDWVHQVLGIDLLALAALDLQTTTTQASAQHAVPVLLNQLNDILGPLDTLPPAQTPELSAALLSAHNIRTELGAAPTPKAILAIRREVAALPALVNAAIISVRQLEQRQQSLIEQAQALNYSQEASQDSEGEIIQTFLTQKAAVAQAFDDGPLTARQVEAAEGALKAADTAREEIAKAVQLRLSTQLAELVLAASKLTFSQDADEGAEGGLIGSFTQQRDAVGLAQSTSPLTGEDIRQARQALDAAQMLRDQINEAVVTRLAQRRLALIEQAKQVRYSADAREQESSLVGTFQQQIGLVTGLPENGLTGKLIRQAEASLGQARDTAKTIDSAVEQRHAAWARDIRERADKLMERFAENDLDPALWATPKATRGEIDKELVPS